MIILLPKPTRFVRKGQIFTVVDALVRDAKVKSKNSKAQHYVGLARLEFDHHAFGVPPNYSLHETFHLNRNTFYTFQFYREKLRRFLIYH